MAKLGASSPERDQEMDARYREAFQSEAGRKKRKKGIKAFFCITLVLSVLVSLLNWGIITGWGNVKVERLTLSGYNGDRISALLYIPKNATSETPAPLVFNCHGNAGNGRNHESWAVEFARRGFVVLSVDLYGSGDSENSAESFASMAMLTSVTDTFYEHMLNRDYVDKDNILGYTTGQILQAGITGYEVQTSVDKLEKGTGTVLSSTLVDTSSYASRDQVVIALEPGPTDPTDPTDPIQPSDPEEPSEPSENTDDPSLPPGGDIPSYF